MRTTEWSVAEKLDMAHDWIQEAGCGADREFTDEARASMRLVLWMCAEVVEKLGRYAEADVLMCRQIREAGDEVAGRQGATAKVEELLDFFTRWFQERGSN